MEKKTIALIYGFPLRAGGVESHLLSLVRHGSSFEFRFLMVGVAEEGFQNEARKLNVPMIEWQGPKRQADLTSLPRLVRVLKESRVDVIHYHSPRGFLQAALAAKIVGIPVVSTVHLPLHYLIRGHGWVARFKLAVYDVVGRIILRRLVARTIFVSSRFCQESIARRLVLPERATVIRNGIEVDRFGSLEQRDTIRRELGVPREAVVACFVGRLEKQKGVDVLIEAFGTVDPNELDLFLWIVGDGPLRGYLEDHARACGAGNRIKFLSYRHDVEVVLGASDLFVLPSRFEAMPIALVEAMASGLPSVVTDVGDNAELVERGVLGLVVPVGDVRALAAAVGRLARDPVERRRMGAGARLAASRYSAQAMASAVKEVYRAALNLSGRGTAG